MLDYNILKQTLYIETSDRERMTINAADVVETRGKQKGGNRSGRRSNNDERSKQQSPKKQEAEQNKPSSES